MTICPYCQRKFKPDELVGNISQKMLPQHCEPIRCHWQKIVYCPGSFKEISQWHGSTHQVARSATRH